MNKNDIKFNDVNIDGDFVTISFRVYIDREVDTMVERIVKDLLDKKVDIDIDSIEYGRK